jgi:hypothetical protein
MAIDGEHFDAPSGQSACRGKSGWAKANDENVGRKGMHGRVAFS